MREKYLANDLFWDMTEPKVKDIISVLMSRHKGCRLDVSSIGFTSSIWSKISYYTRRDRKRRNYVISNVLKMDRRSAQLLNRWKRVSATESEGSHMWKTRKDFGNERANCGIREHAFFAQQVESVYRSSDIVIR